MALQLHLTCGALLLLAAAEGIAAESIYRCAIDGRTVLTDRPADPALCEPLIPSPGNTFVAPPTRPVKTNATTLSERERSRDDSIAAEQLKAKQRCERIDLRLEQIANKMRAGYTVKQGEKLREQKEQLEATRRIERCR